jgi:hypothetical protein
LTTDGADVYIADHVGFASFDYAMPYDYEASARLLLVVGAAKGGGKLNEILPLRSSQLSRRLATAKNETITICFYKTFLLNFEVAQQCQELKPRLPEKLKERP